MNEINNIQVDNAKCLNAVVPTIDLIKQGDNYSRTSETLCQYHRDSESFKPMVKTIGKTPDDGNTKGVKTAVLLKYFSNFWRTLETSLINCEINLTLKRSSTCVITNSTGAETFPITDTKYYVPVVTLWTQDNVKLLQ